MNIASLGIQVTADGVQQAQSDLDKLADSGDKAAASTDKLNQSARSSAQTLRDTSAIKAQQDALAKLLGQIDPTVAAFGKLDQQQAKLAAFKAAGAISADDFKVYSAAIDDARAKVGGASEAVAKFTLNNAAARRELGYLVKDMATGQWGRFDQSLATLISRSGALEAVFSTAGAAIAGFVAEGLIFITAANDAASVQNKFNEALAKTGDYVGISTQGLSKLSSQVAGASGNLTLANGVLTALAANGKVTSTSLLALGQAAYDMAQLTGENADKAAAAVTQMFDGTAKSAEKANDQYHFLTLEVYDQIAALEKQGDSQKAVEVAATAFHDAISPRIDQMNAQVTGIAAAWDKVKTSFTGFWETFKQGASLIAGTADLQTQIYALQGQKQRAQDNTQSFGGRMLNSFGEAWTADDDRKLADLQAQLAKKMQDADTAAQAQQVQDAGIAGQAALNGYLKKYESTEQQRQDQIVAIHNAANKAIAAALAKGDQSLADQIMQQEADADAAARASWAKKGQKADPMAPLNSLTAKAITQDMMPNDASSAENKLLDEQVKKLQAIADAGAKAIEKGSSLAQVQAQVAQAVSATNDYYSKQADLLQQGEHPDRAQVEIGLANSVALRVLASKYGLDQTQLCRHRQRHMDADLIARLKTRGHRSDEELTKIREIESKSLLDHLVWQRGRLYRNADRALEIGDFAGERAAMESAGKTSERIGKLLGELGSAITINQNTQINLVQSPQWHAIRTALVRELRPLGAAAIEAGARAIAAAEASIAQPAQLEPILLEALP